MNDNYMKTILSGVKEWTENLTDDAIDKANNALDKALFVVNITQNRDGTFSADKTFAEIIKVYKEGKYSIVANMALGAGVYTHPLLAISNYNAVFSCAMAEGGIQGIASFIIADNNKVALRMTPLATTNSKLPNPYPLTFTGAVNETYDGSSAKTIEIPIGLDGATGPAGQSAYAAAQAGGYTDTEANFYADLAAIQGLASALAALANRVTALEQGIGPT